MVLMPLYDISKAKGPRSDGSSFSDSRKTRDFGRLCCINIQSNFYK